MKSESEKGWRMWETWKGKKSAESRAPKSMERWSRALHWDYLKLETKLGHSGEHMIQNYYRHVS